MRLSRIKKRVKGMVRKQRDMKSKLILARARLVALETKAGKAKTTLLEHSQRIGALEAL